MNPKNIWFTSDTHFGHRAVIGFCERPWDNVDDMNEAILDNINSTVKKGDFLWHLGDLSMRINKVKVAELSSRIRCAQKNLILGNHDNWPTRWYMENGWTWASRYPIIMMDFLLLSHSQQFLSPTSTFVNLHGHCHNALPHRPNKQYFNLCVEVTDYKPVNLEYILDSIKKDGGEINYGRKNEN